MAYGSTLVTSYDFMYSSKNSWPSGGYWSGDRVATVTLTFAATSGGRPPSSATKNSGFDTPSGPYNRASGIAADTSLKSCTAPLGVTPANTKQSTPMLSRPAAWARKFGALGSIPSLVA